MNHKFKFMVWGILLSISFLFAVRAFEQPGKARSLPAGRTFKQPRDLKSLPAGGAFKQSEKAQSDEIGLIFSHKKHLDMDYECETCHVDVAESDSGRDNNLPDMDLCLTCHDGETAPDDCEVCHSDPENPAVVPRIDTYSSKFTHRKHIEKGYDCATCHPGVESVDLATLENIPRMSSCLDCHSVVDSPSDCYTCHESRKEILPGNHTLSWINFHQDEAAANESSCSLCHQEQFCQQCHQGDNVFPRTHPLNYRYTHSIIARGRELECRSCHEEVDFCSSCHRDNFVLPSGHSSLNWVNPSDGGKHGISAREDMEYCESCHSLEGEEPGCKKCHI
ncbi:MAG: cytochrome c3 family protein [Fidelibacterota bacterium]